MVNQPLPVAGTLTATVYSVESVYDSSDIVITVSTDSTASPATLTSQLTQPLEQMLAEVTDINEQISFAVVAIERHGMSDTWRFSIAYHMITMMTCCCMACL